jgi:hypothetical protein
MRMAHTLTADRLGEALKKATQVGLVEEEVTIAGCTITLQSLTPDDYEAIIAELEELEDVEYYHAYQLGHVCRSIIELDGQDLREVAFIEDEAPNGFLLWATVPTQDAAQAVTEAVKGAGGEASLVPSEEKRTVKYERHEWLRKKLLPSWSREALGVAWRKFAETLVTAEEKAKEGVVFRVPEETAEDKLRRLVGEVMEIHEELPEEIVDKVLEDAGLRKWSKAKEIEEATGRIDKLAQEAAPEAPQARPVPEGAPAAQVAPEAPQGAARGPSGLTPQELMDRRQPMDLRGVQAPNPSATTTRQESASKRPKVPDQLRQAAIQNSAGMTGRSAEIAALEAQLDPTMAEPIEPVARPPSQRDDVPVLERRAKPLDAGAASTIIDPPPPVGLNPRYKPHQR